jgi:hypothetical protein
MVKLADNPSSPSNPCGLRGTSCRRHMLPWLPPLTDAGPPSALCADRQPFAAWCHSLLCAVAARLFGALGLASAVGQVLGRRRRHAIGARGTQPQDVVWCLKSWRLRPLRTRKTCAMPISPDLLKLLEAHYGSPNALTWSPPLTMAVRNLNGTSYLQCGCGSWLDHDRSHGGESATYCSARISPATVGGHVQRDDVYDRAWYIVPLCSSCNSRRGGDLQIWRGTTLVPANIHETCGRYRGA